MHRKIWIVLLSVACLCPSAYAQEDMQAKANEIADNLGPVEELIRGLKISEAIDELNFIVGELQNLTTDKISAILKQIEWPGQWKLDGEPSTTAVGAQVFGGGTGFELDLVNSETGERVGFNLVESPMVQSILQLANLPFASGGQKRVRIGSHKGMQKDDGKELQVAYGGVHLGTWRYEKGSGEAGDILTDLAKFFGGEPYDEVKAAL